MKKKKYQEVCPACGVPFEKAIVKIENKQILKPSEYENIYRTFIHNNASLSLAES